MSECIYDNDLYAQMEIQEMTSVGTGEGNEVKERIVSFYESSDFYKDHKAAPQQRAVLLQPGRTFFRPLSVCLMLLCVLLLAGLIGTGLHCSGKLQTDNEIWAEKRKQTLVELSHFCKDGCTSLNNSFYYFSSDYKSWQDSRQDCKDRGADLIIVNSEEEQEFISPSRNRYWIGLQRSGEEGTWKWVDGSVLNSTQFWYDGEPSGSSGRVKKDCVDTYRYTPLGSWYANNCDRQQLWICEKVTSY